MYLRHPNKRHYSKRLMNWLENRKIKSRRGGLKAKRQKPLTGKCQGLCCIKNGGVLLSHTVARAVPSAQKSLTSVFGMGTGGSSLL